MSDQLQRTIKRLETLQNDWPEGYWLYANGVNLYFMKTHPDGSRHVAGESRMDENLIVTHFSIPCEGGDW